MQFDAGNPIVVPYGPERDDTVTTSGGAANGFALQINYNVLGPGEHQAVVFDDGVEFDRMTFNVADAGVKFLTGVTACWP